MHLAPYVWLKFFMSFAALYAHTPAHAHRAHRSRSLWRPHQAKAPTPWVSRDPSQLSDFEKGGRALPPSPPSSFGGADENHPFSRLPDFGGEDHGHVFSQDSPPLLSKGEHAAVGSEFKINEIVKVPYMMREEQMMFLYQH